jgi:DNA-binding HxlR family transcriptional regulator
MEGNTALHPDLPDTSFDPSKRAVMQESVESKNRRAFLAAANLLSKRWTLFIIANLLVGSQSFHELAKHTQGISDRTLSERLKELEHEGIVRRQVHAERPIRVTYHLTARGEALEPVVKAICAWGQLF